MQGALIATKVLNYSFLFLALEIAGNFLYALNYSVWFPLLGRFVSGFGDVCNVIMTGEVAKNYPQQEVTKKLTYLVTCFSVGFIIAPGANIIFHKIEINLHVLLINYGNFPGILMSFLFTLIFATVKIFVHDLSSEFDFKQHEIDKINKSKCQINSKFPRILETNNDGKETDFLLVKNHQQKDGNDNEEMTRFKILSLILRQPDLVLVLVFSFIASYTLFAFDTLLSLIANTYFGFGVQTTSLIFIVDGVIYAIVLTILGCLSKKCSDFSAILVSFSILISGLFAILMLSVLKSPPIEVKYALLVVYLVAFSTTWTIEEVLSRSLFSKLVPSWCQNFGEGVRRSISSVSFIISGVSSSGLFDGLPYLCSFLILVSFVLMALFFNRRKCLAKPKPLF